MTKELESSAVQWSLHRFHSFCPKRRHPPKKEISLAQVRHIYLNRTAAFRLSGILFVSHSSQILGKRVSKSTSFLGEAVHIQSMQSTGFECFPARSPHIQLELQQLQQYSPQQHPLWRFAEQPRRLPFQPSKNITVLTGHSWRKQASTEGGGTLVL